MPLSPNMPDMPSSISFVSVPNHGCCAMKIVISSLLNPIRIGTSADCSGAAGMKGSRGRTTPSTTGPKLGPPGPPLPSTLRPAANNVSAGTARRSSAVSAPTSASSLSASAAASSALPDVTPGPDWMIAFWNRPSAAGIASRWLTFEPPPLSPMIVTFAGSPPKPAILSRTHSRLATRSRFPALPDLAKSSPKRCASDR